MVVTKITEHLLRIRARIADAAGSAGRNEHCVNILAVSKRHPAATVRSALAAGLTDFGENLVQEGVGKIEQIGDAAVWHLIGRVQSNKTRLIAEHFDWVQTVCSHKVAERLNSQRPHHAPRLQVCLQLRPSNAPDRSGAAADAIPALAETISRLPRLELRGIMIIPLPGQAEPVLRAEFRRAREVMESLREYSKSIDTLSMGMSADLEAAVKEGSTMVRIGTDLFGPRNG